MPDISLKLQLKPKVTQLQQLTVKLLSLHAQDLTDYLQEQVTDNPLIDIRYPDLRPSAGSGNEKPIENVRGHEESLEDMLMKQLRLLTISRDVLMAAGLVIQSLDEKGFFSGDLDHIGQDYGLTMPLMQKGLEVVQSLDPAGVGATSLREAMLLQSKRREKIPEHTLELLLDHYEDFLKGNWQRLEKDMSISAAELNDIRNFLKTLSLQPAQQISQEEEYIRADAEIFISKNGKIGIRFLEEIPEVFFREDLFNDYKEAGDKKTKSYVRKARQAFLNLQSALAFRQQSVLLVLNAIIARQELFFRNGAALRPLTQKKVAAETGMSESTVSRVCRNRYVLFNGRIYSLRHFFTQAYTQQGLDDEDSISDQAIKEEIARLIREEDADHPYSDQEITEHFQNKHIKIARRTIAKFRMELGFVNSNMRRRMHN